MKRVVAGVLTLGALLAIAWWRSAASGSVAGHSSAKECVQQMFQSATRGDVQGYLDCFSGPVRQQMQQQLSGASISSSESLRQSVADLKGWAIIDPPLESEKQKENASQQCKLVVEWVYGTRVDRQELGLERGFQGWQITRVDRIQPTQPMVPYGTPVYAVPP